MNYELLGIVTVFLVLGVAIGGHYVHEYIIPNVDIYTEPVVEKPVAYYEYCKKLNLVC